LHISINQIPVTVFPSSVSFIYFFMLYLVKLLKDMA
jgi:hypothetical protein